jgi:hypothetical protein
VHLNKDSPCRSTSLRQHPEIHDDPQICRALVELGHSVTVITGAPAGFFVRELHSPRLVVRKAYLDFGAKQRDAFSVDMAGEPARIIFCVLTGLNQSFHCNDDSAGPW